MLNFSTQVSEYQDFVEVDPTERYGRYNEILGRGASKTVYRAFDEYEGIEVAWNQVKLNAILQSPEDLGRLYCEIHLLKTLRHKNIMKFYSSWIDTSKRNINFVTELFTSGTLRQYRMKHRRVNIRALKHWCRQILSGLLYLHSHDPPIIHRDLKCDNIFINGNQGEVKIGDLGLAAILRKPLADHCVGTPEFMAPEVYEEAYNELVDIHSFGMCVLEMVTLEYPYSECTHPAQIYKKVLSGAKPQAFFKIKDPEVRQFVEKCLAPVLERPSARELLNDTFLRIDETCLSYWEGDITALGQIMRQPSYSYLQSDGSWFTCGFPSEDQPYAMFENWWEQDATEFETPGIELLYKQDVEICSNLDITIKGMREDDNIFLRLRISDREGHVRNIYFPFDIENDTALGVAAEMIAELNITDHDVTRIAKMIDGEVSSLSPKWKPGLDIDEIPDYLTTSSVNCKPSTSSCLKCLLINNKNFASNAKSTSYSHLDCALHAKSTSSNVLYISRSDEKHRYLDLSADHETVKVEDFQPNMPENHENDTHKKAICLEEHLLEIGEKQFDGSRSVSPSTSLDFRELEVENMITSPSADELLQGSAEKPIRSFPMGKSFHYHISSGDTSKFNLSENSTQNSNAHHWCGGAGLDARRARKCKKNTGNNPEDFFALRSLYSVKSLPVNVVDVRNT